MIKGKAAYVGVRLLDAAGDPVVGETPTVETSPDAAAYGGSTNPASASDAKGRSKVLLTALETDADSLQISWESTTAVPIHQTVPGLIPLSTPTGKVGTTAAATVEAAILTTPANTIAAGDGSGQVASSNMRGTDGASTHSADDAGTDAAAKILATPANLLATNVSGEVTAENMRGTDNAREYGVAETKTHGTSGDTLPQTVTKA